MVGDPAHADLIAQIADGNGRNRQLTQFRPEQVGLGFQRGDVPAARVVVNAQLVRARRFDGDRRGGRSMSEQLIDGGGRLRQIFREADDAHAHRHFAHGVDIFIDMQTDDAGAAAYRLNAVLRTDDDGLCVKGEDERAGEQHGGNHAVHLRHFMRQKHKTGQDIDHIARLDRIDERLSGVHGQRFAGRLAAARVEDAADAVAPRIEIHQGIEVFAYVAFFKFVTVHSSHRPFAVMKQNKKSCNNGTIIHA